MDIVENINVMRQAHDEIIGLRRRIAELEPKAHAYETIAAIARLNQNGRNLQGFGEDVAWRLQNVVDRLNAERLEEREAERAGEDHE